MFARLALTALLFASAPMIGAMEADAAPRDGKRFERSGAKSVKNNFAKNKKATKPAKKSTNFAKKKSNLKQFNFGYYFGNKRFQRRGNSCVAAAKRAGGFGNRLRGIGSKAYGPRACARAMNECRAELRHRKARGRNPFAKCVVVSRG